MWSKGTDMAQADTPAFALHLWTRVQPLVSVRAGRQVWRVQALGDRGARLPLAGRQSTRRPDEPCRLPPGAP